MLYERLSFLYDLSFQMARGRGRGRRVGWEGTNDVSGREKKQMGRLLLVGMFGMDGMIVATASDNG